jgi:2-polyprenyl-3-methyl-5-hydroxy-6-metoxy-1,4-benzoquinol methylase
MSMTTGISRHPGDRFMKVPSFGPLEQIDCELCGASDSTLVTVQHLFGEDFRVVRCARCRLMRTNPRPTPAWTAHFYDPRYNAFAQTQGRDFFYAATDNRIPGYRRLLRFLQGRTRPGAKLLDVGCASGVFVKEAREHGFDAWGCDYSDAAVAYGKIQYGLNLFHSSAEAVDAADDSYDVVTMLHVIEHLPQPVAVLREMHRILKPGGILFLETPNYWAHYLIEKRLPFLIRVYARLTKREGLPWVPFDHLYHWTPATLSQAMTQAGYGELATHHLFGYRSEGKLGTVFSAVYGACDVTTTVVRVLSLGQCDLWPVLLATGVRPN